MEKKQLRTVKKSKETGRLDRDAVRSTVIALRDERSGQHSGRSHSSDGAGTRRTRHAGQVAAGCVAGD
jgi:hypothetical protein